LDDTFTQNIWNENSFHRNGSYNRHLAVGGGARLLVDGFAVLVLLAVVADGLRNTLRCADGLDRPLVLWQRCRRGP
jgi:hypothetical protein